VPSPEKFDPDKQKITWIPVKQLSVIWVQSQRPYRPFRAKKIADNFDPDRFDPIKVTLPNGAGIYHIVEGQHRKGAVQLLWGDEYMAPCIIIEVEDPAEAARVFVGINSLRWGVDQISTFKVNVTAREKRECAILKIVEQCGYKVGNLQEGDSRYISAVSALIAIYDGPGPMILKTVLELLSATWNDDPTKTNGNILRGYGLLLNEYGTTKINIGTLKKAVANKFTPGSLIHSAKDDQDTYGGTMGEAVARVLLAIYNRNVVADKKLKRKE
jgi:hypothetical protein